MCSIVFVDRRDGREIDALFFLKDGDCMQSIEPYHVGDKVSVIFEVTPEQAERIIDMDVSAPIFVNGLHLPCEVAERCHAIAWKSVGQMQVVSSTVALMASSGLWEDVLLWIVRDKVPTWAMPCE